MAPHELTMRILDALRTVLPNEDDRLGRIVEVTEGWGGILFVTVHSGLAHHHAAAEIFEERIRSVVRSVLDDRRHVVKVVWAPDPA